MFENGAIKRLISSMKDFFNKTINDAIEKIFNVSLIFYNDYKNGFFFQSQIKWDGGNIMTMKRWRILFVRDKKEKSIKEK